MILALSLRLKVSEQLGPFTISRYILLLLYPISIATLIQFFLFRYSLMVHIILLAIISYVSLLTIPPQYIHLVTLAVAIGHLSYLHIDRLVHDYSIYTVDITA